MRFSSCKNILWMLGFILTLASANTARADEALRKVQQSLRDQGFYYGSIDGSPGDETTQAIRRYQIRNGLGVSGQLNDETRNSIARTGAVGGGTGASTSAAGRGTGNVIPLRTPATAPDSSAVPGSRSVPAPASNSRDRAAGNDESEYRLVPRQTVQPPPQGNGSINGNDDQDNADDRSDAAPPPYRGGRQDRPDLRVPPPQYGGAGNPPSSARGGTAPSPTLTALFEQTPYEFAPPPVQSDLLRRVQIQLSRSGFYDGETDGLPGQRTTEAIANFQEVNRLRRTARLDISTLEVLHLMPGRQQYADPRGYPRRLRGVYEGRIVE